MRRGPTFAIAAVASFLGAAPLAAATAEMEQAFLAAFTAALQARDTDALRGLVHTEGVGKAMLDFYLGLLAAPAGTGQVSAELQALSADDITDADRAMVGPGGVVVRLAPKPYKKLVVSVAVNGASGTSTSTMTVYVADEGDRIRIAAPVDVNVR